MTDPKTLIREAAFIGGEWRAAGGEAIDVDNPATGEIIGRVPACGAAETEAAIEAAQRAFEGWRAVTAKERAGLLRRLAAHLEQNAEPLAALMTLEQGKPLAESRTEIALGARYFLWFAGEAERAYGETIPSPWADKRILVTKEPVGVVGAITPWNFPHAMIARKLSAALAAGCAMVLKPASQTPFSALAIGAVMEEIGFPPGLFNVVTGPPEPIADTLCAHPLVRKITFTGSTAVGKSLGAKALAHMKRVSMELGGNAPFIVFDDADIARAADGAIASKFRNMGQTCVCANRFLVHASVYDAFADAFAERMRALTVGDGMEEGVRQGPLIDDKAVAKVEAHVADALARGGQIVTGGKRHPRGGRFFEPTLILDAAPGMRIACEETFGPVAALFRFETEEQAIAMANDTEYGLAAYFYTRDLGRAFRVMERLKYGMVGVNEGLATTEVAPFGGVKESGMGREGSKYGLEDYLDVKYALVGGL